MATDTYIINRKKYRRPQALCLADNPGTIINDMIVPNGTEFSNFIILSDHGRSSINMAPSRIETRKRAINGRMRAYWTADKLTISTSWEMLPSRGWVYTGVPGSELPIDPISGMSTLLSGEYANMLTADGGAGGNELLEWYRGHKGSFWAYLAYDRYPVAGAYDKLGEYNEVVEVFFSDFSYDVAKRGATNTDLWNIDLKLEEA